MGTRGKGNTLSPVVLGLAITVPRDRVERSRGCPVRKVPARQAVGFRR